MVKKEKGGRIMRVDSILLLDYITIIIIIFQGKKEKEKTRKEQRRLENEAGEYGNIVTKSRQKQSEDSNCNLTTACKIGQFITLLCGLQLIIFQRE